MRDFICFSSGTPKGLDFKEVMEDLQNIRAVKMVHNLHIWSLTMGTAALSVHLAIGKLDFCLCFNLAIIGLVISLRIHSSLSTLEEI